MSYLGGTVRGYQGSNQGVLPNVKDEGNPAVGAYPPLPDGDYQMVNLTVAGGVITALGSQGRHTNTSGIDAGAVAIIGTDSMAIGVGATCLASDCVVIGPGSQALGDTAVVIGHDNSVGAATQRAVCIGNSLVNNGADDTVQIGTDCTVGPGTDSVCIGHDAFCQGNRAVAIGYAATANFGSAEPLNIGSNIAIGNNSQAGTSVLYDAIAIGRDTQAIHTGTIAIGRDAAAASVGAMAIGTNADCSLNTADYGIAVGTDSVVGGRDCVALGYEAQTQPGVVQGTALGSRTDVFVQDGLAIGHGAQSAAHVFGVSNPFAISAGTTAIGGGPPGLTTSSNYLRVNINGTNYTIALLPDQ